ncbi:MAG TPA: archaeal heat shock protein Hsp20 [Candidatus Bathyarchaeia archaeon]|jgi:HSP20 family protein|nr:archaeal heat shock protein Hsp20 [Candidatus Bathyarchaeia archaeon]
MSSDDDSSEWFRKKRYPFFKDWGFDDMDKIFGEMEKMMEEEFKNFAARIPKDYVRERKLPDGRVERELGPFVYGYSVKIGPDGKPEINEFGNVKQSRLGPPQVKEEREPLVDIIETNGEIRIVAELPGVEKEDIKLHGTEDSITITVDKPQRKYYKEAKLPAKVNVKEAKTTYKNGVLEIILPKLKDAKKPKGELINIE